MKGRGSALLSFFQWLFFGVWCLCWMTAAILFRLLFTRDDNKTLAWARKYWGPGLVWATRTELKVAPGFVPEPGQPYIFVMNHQSMFDIVVAFVTIPVNIRFIAKKILRSIPLLGWYMRSVGMVFIDRNDHEQAVQSLSDACDKIRGGISILVYPEGTRSTDGRILPFKKGPFVMAIQAGVPIVPVAVDGSGDLLPRSGLRISRVPVRVALGQPIPTSGLTQADRETLMRRVRDALIDLHVSIGGRGGDKSDVVARRDKGQISLASRRSNSPTRSSAAMSS